jgi:hypothetical protein
VHWPSFFRESTEAVLPLAALGKETQNPREIAQGSKGNKAQLPLTSNLNRLFILL